MKELTDAKAKELGKHIAEFLNLKVHNGCVLTDYGRKNLLGLGHMVAEMVKDAGERQS